MVNNQNIIKYVEAFARDVKNSGLNLKAVILYGSYAKNKQHEYSDVDVALVADEFIGVGFEDIKLFVRSLRNYIDIQPRTFPTDYFEKGDPFIEEIKKTGIEIKIN